MITGYRIQQAEGATGGTFADVVANTASTAVTYTDTGLTAGTAYRYRVAAINSVGVGPYSAEVSIEVSTLGLDVNGDGEVTSSDTLAIYYASSGLASSLGSSAGLRSSLLGGLIAGSSDDAVLTGLLTRATAVLTGTALDVNEDGEVTSSDTLAIYYASSGLASSLGSSAGLRSSLLGGLITGSTDAILMGLLMRATALVE